jgi:hypothetical protein
MFIFTCLSSHVYLHMFIFTCLSSHVYLHMFIFTCLSLWVLHVVPVVNTTCGLCCEYYLWPLLWIRLLLWILEPLLWAPAVVVSPCCEPLLWAPAVSPCCEPCCEPFPWLWCRKLIIGIFLFFLLFFHRLYLRRSKWKLEKLKELNLELHCPNFSEVVTWYSTSNPYFPQN